MTLSMFKLLRNLLGVVLSICLLPKLQMKLPFIKEFVLGLYGSIVTTYTVDDITYTSESITSEDVKMSTLK